MEKILIVRLGAMGDVLHALPAVAALRQARPQAHIGWLVEERWASLLAARDKAGGWGREEDGACGCRPGSPQQPLVDRVHTVDTIAWRMAPISAGTWRQIIHAGRRLRAAGYETALDLQGAVKSAMAARLSRAGQVYGADPAREAVASLFYSRRFPLRGEHVIEQAHALVCDALGDNLPLTRPQLPVDAAAEEWVEREIARRGIYAFAVLNPGAGWGAKCWPAERLGAVAAALGQHGLRSYVNAGPGEEELALEAVAASSGFAEPLRCSVAELVSLLRRARLFVGGDTGPLHLAAALKVPVVGIYGPTDPARNGPFATANIVLRSPESATSHARRSQPEPGMLSIPTAAVIAAARQLLGETSE